MTILDSLLGMAVIGITIMGLVRGISFSQNASMSVRDRADINRIRSDILSGLSCSTTINSINIGTDCVSGAFVHATGYAAGPYVTPLAASGVSLFVNNQYDTWKLRTKCVRNGTLKSLVVYASRYVGGVATFDRLTGKSQDWQPLFKPEVTICERQLTSGTQTASVASAPALSPLGAPYVWAAGQNNYVYVPEFFANGNHWVGRISRTTAACPANFMPVRVSAGLNVDFTFRTSTCVPSSLSYADDFSTATNEYGCSFDHSNDASTEFDLLTRPLATTCVRVHQ